MIAHLTTLLLGSAVLASALPVFGLESLPSALVKVRTPAVKSHPSLYTLGKTTRLKPIP